MNDKAVNEWEAWQKVVRLWPEDINQKKFNKLVKAIKNWGDAYATLKLSLEEEESE